MMAEYWNREFETMPWARLQEYWLERLKDLIAYTMAGSDFYREHLKGIKIDCLKSFDDVRGLPWLMKNEGTMWWPIWSERPSLREGSPTLKG